MLHNGVLIVKSILTNGSNVVFFKNGTAAFLHMKDHPGSKIIGYRHSLFAKPASDYIFMTDSGQPLRFDNIVDAEQYIYEHGWDDDNSTTIGNYFSILNRMKNPPQPNMKSIYIEESTDPSMELTLPKKCDCGGVKCNLPCVDWCSTRRV